MAHDRGLAHAHGLVHDHVPARDRGHWHTGHLGSLGEEEGELHTVPREDICHGAGAGSRPSRVGGPELVEVAETLEGKARAPGDHSSREEADCDDGNHRVWDCIREAAGDDHSSSRQEEAHSHDGGEATAIGIDHEEPVVEDPEEALTEDQRYSEQDLP